MQVKLDYEPSTGGELSYIDSTGTKIFIAYWVGLEHLAVKENSSAMPDNKIDNFVKLKNSGMTATEIVEIYQAGIT